MKTWKEKNQNEKAQMLRSTFSNGVEFYKDHYAINGEELSQEEINDMCDSIDEMIKWKYGELASHSEKQIVKGCISLLDEMYTRFLDYLEYMGVEYEKDSEEEPVFTMSYFHIVQRLLLFCTSHCGGTSTRAKCDELGLDSSVDVEFRKEWENDE